MNKRSANDIAALYKDLLPYALAIGDTKGSEQRVGTDCIYLQTLDVRDILLDEPEITLEKKIVNEIIPRWRELEEMYCMSYDEWLKKHREITGTTVISRQTKLHGLSILPPNYDKINPPICSLILAPTTSSSSSAAGSSSSSSSSISSSSGSGQGKYLSKYIQDEAWKELSQISHPRLPADLDLKVEFLSQVGSLLKEAPLLEQLREELYRGYEGRTGRKRRRHADDTAYTIDEGPIVAQRGRPQKEMGVGMHPKDRAIWRFLKDKGMDKDNNNNKKNDKSPRGVLHEDKDKDNDKDGVISETVVDADVDDVRSNSAPVPVLGNVPGEYYQSFLRKNVSGTSEGKDKDKGTMLLTFETYGAYNTHLSASSASLFSILSRQQQATMCVDNQTLLDLQRELYCVQDHTRAYCSCGQCLGTEKSPAIANSDCRCVAASAGLNPEESFDFDSGSGNNNNSGGSFFFIEGVFYVYSPPNSNKNKNKNKNDNEKEDKTAVSVPVHERYLSALTAWLAVVASSDSAIEKRGEKGGEETNLYLPSRKNVSRQELLRAVLESNESDESVSLSPGDKIHTHTIYTPQGAPVTVQVRSMNDTPLGDVPMRLGAKYLYVHGGNRACEHFVYLSGLRAHSQHTDLPLSRLALVTKTENEGEDASVSQDPRGQQDQQDQGSNKSNRSIDQQWVEREREHWAEEEYEYEHYPSLLAMSNYSSRTCGICESRWASRVVYGDRLCTESPAYMCGQCYHMLHYSSNGSKDAEPQLLYNDFRVFPYIHDMDEKPHHES